VAEAIQPPSPGAEEASEPTRRSSAGARHDDPSLSGAVCFGETGEVQMVVTIYKAI